MKNKLARERLAQAFSGHLCEELTWEQRENTKAGLQTVGQDTTKKARDTGKPCALSNKKWLEPTWVVGSLRGGSDEFRCQLRSAGWLEGSEELHKDRALDGLDGGFKECDGLYSWLDSQRDWLVERDR